MLRASGVLLTPAVVVAGSVIWAIRSRMRGSMAPSPPEPKTPIQVFAVFARSGTATHAVLRPTVLPSIARSVLPIVVQVDPASTE